MQIHISSRRFKVFSAIESQLCNLPVFCEIFRILIPFFSSYCIFCFFLRFSGYNNYNELTLKKLHSKL